MMGRTHYIVGILYYLLFSMIPMCTILGFSNNKTIVFCILAAAVGAIFPDADSDHSLINSRNPIFKTSNKVINNSKKRLKRLYSFIFFSTPAALIILYIYRENRYSKELLAVVVILFVLAFNGVKIGEKIYIPIFTDGLRAINAGAARVKKIFMMLVYLSLGAVCIYLGRGSTEGIVWGTIFIFIAIFPHRTFLHSPEGIILVTVGVRYLEKRLHISNISIAFFIGYFSHLYLADIFTNSGIPISTLPSILKKIGLHKKLKNNKIYMKFYSFFDTRLSIPLIKTGSKLGSILEGLYVVCLSILVFTIFLKYRSV